MLLVFHIQLQVFDASDIDIALTGSFTITSNTDTLAINIAADATTEGSESLTLTLDGLGEDVSGCNQ